MRRNGEIDQLDGSNEDLIDFGYGAKPTIAMPWGDVSTAYHSTKIPNIEVHFESSPQIARMMKMPFLLKAFLGLPFMQSFLKRQIDKQPEGPTDEQRRKGEAILIGVARNGKGETVRTRLRTPEGYTLTTATALADRAARGERRREGRIPDAESRLRRRFHLGVRRRAA